MNLITFQILLRINIIDLDTRQFNEYYVFQPFNEMKMF